MKAHAKLSASGAKKWINCPGSILLEGNEPNTSSKYTEEGTLAHLLGEVKIKSALNKMTQADYRNAVAGLCIERDMEDYTQEYRDFVLERYNHALSRDKHAEILIEEKLDYSSWAPGGFGTGDIVLLFGDTIEVIDLKYGKGVKVEAKENLQMMLYALGALQAYSYLYLFTKVRITVYQPRMDNIDSWEISVKDLLAWGESIKQAAQLADSGTDECRAGSHCDEGFCRARPKCRAYSEEKIKIAKSEFQLPSTLSNAEIAEILGIGKRLKNWVAMVEEYARDKALQGEEFPGYKVVEGKSIRKYKDEQDVIDTLLNHGYEIDDIAPRKILALTHMEKLVGKQAVRENLGEFIVKPQGAPTLVTIEDKRPVLNSAQEDFKNEYKEMK